MAWWPSSSQPPSALSHHHLRSCVPANYSRPSQPQQHQQQSPGRPAVVPGPGPGFGGFQFQFHAPPAMSSPRSASSAHRRAPNGLLNTAAAAVGSKRKRGLVPEEEPLQLGHQQQLWAPRNGLPLPHFGPFEQGFPPQHPNQHPLLPPNAKRQKLALSPGQGNAGRPVRRLGHLRSLDPSASPCRVFVPSTQSQSQSQQQQQHQPSAEVRRPPLRLQVAAAASVSCDPSAMVLDSPAQTHGINGTASSAASSLSSAASITAAGSGPDPFAAGFSSLSQLNLAEFPVAVQTGEAADMLRAVWRVFAAAPLGSAVGTAEIVQLLPEVQPPQLRLLLDVLASRGRIASSYSRNRGGFVWQRLR